MSNIQNNKVMTMNRSTFPKAYNSTDRATLDAGQARYQRARQSELGPIGSLRHVAFASIVQLAALGFPDSASAARPSHVQLRRTGSQTNGFACVEVVHACAEPEESTVSLDNRTVRIPPDVDGRTIPTVVCFDQGDHGNGRHVARVRSTCKGTTTEASLRLDFDMAGLKLKGIEPMAE